MGVESVSHFDGLRLVVEVGKLMIGNAVVTAIMNPEPHNGDGFLRAMELVRKVGYSNGNGWTEWDPKHFLNCYPEFEDAYLEGYGEGSAKRFGLEELEDLEGFDEVVDSEVVSSQARSIVVFCPNGHNQTLVKRCDLYQECAACGSRMSEDAEESFFDALEACGQLM